MGKLGGSSLNDATRQYAVEGTPPSTRWEAAWSIRHTHHPATIHFARPGRTIPISLTGRACALQCAHCNGVYLRHMRTVNELPDAMQRASSFLVSGGCDAQGRVPVLSHLDKLARVQETHRLNWHVGMIDEDTIRRLAPHADVVSFDVVGSRDTTRRIYGLDLSLDDYMATLDALARHVRVVPHITIGLDAGEIIGERDAVRALAQRQIKRLVFIVLIPTAGTELAGCQPPSPEQVADFFLWTRSALPRCELYLGCMRPRGDYRRRLDAFAVRAGLNGIVNPSPTARDLAIELGLEPIWSDECCALS